MPTAKTSILLVEDDAEDAFLVQRLLDLRGDGQFAVRHVSNASDAIRTLTKGGVDVVLLDLGLPDSQGFETVVRIRTSFPGVPVVVLTGIDDESLGLAAIECGAQDYVSKDAVAGQLLFRALRFAVARHNQLTLYRTQARTDALTGLANRHAFSLELERMLGSWQRTGHPFSLLLLDVDHFKKVNDQFGHRAGDDVLCQLAEVVSDSIAGLDFAARFGGEEFVIIKPESAADEAREMGARIVSLVRETCFQFNGETLPITVSLGLAVVAPQDREDSLVERADTALYAAKAAGRDCSYYHDGEQCHRVSPAHLAAT